MIETQHLKKMRTFAFNSHQLIMGQSGCLHEKTLIHTHKGFKRIADLEDDDLVLSYDFQKKLTFFSKHKKINTGKKKLYKITLEEGQTVIASEDHIFFTKGGKECTVKQLLKKPQPICIVENLRKATI